MQGVAEGGGPAGSLAPIGAWLGPWEVLGPLGRGGFAEVVRARRQDGVEAALKVSRDRERVRPDPGLGVHPHIVSTLEAGLDHDPPWVALELAAGGSLRGALQVGGLEPRVALRLVTEVAAALDHAHGRGVLHLDVKPENVLLDGPLPAGRARLADFGAVRPEPRVEHSLLGASQTGAAARTRGYAAPELLEGAGVVDRRADVWGLGALAFELLTGRRPVGLDRPTDLAPHLPRAVDAALAAALTADPLRRQPSAGHLARDLAAAFAGAPPRPPAIGPAPEPPTPPARPRRGRLVVAAAAFGLAGLGAAVLALQPLPAPPAPGPRPPRELVQTDARGGRAVTWLLIDPDHRRPTAVLDVARAGPAADPSGNGALHDGVVDELRVRGLAARGQGLYPGQEAWLQDPLQRRALIKQLGAAQVVDPVQSADDGAPHLLLVDLLDWRVVAATPPRTPGLAELGRRVSGWFEARSGQHERSLAVLPLTGASQDETALHAELVAAIVGARAPRLIVRPRFGAAERLRKDGEAGLAARLVLATALEVRPKGGAAPTRLLRVALRDVDTSEVLGATTAELP